MTKTQPTDFVFGIEKSAVQKLLETQHGFFPDYDVREMGFQTVGGTLTYLSIDSPNIRKFVGYGLRYCINDGQVHYAVHLKSKVNPSSGVISAVLSLGVGEHLSVDLLGRVKDKVRDMGENLVLMAKTTVGEEVDAVNYFSRLIGHRNPEATSLGVVVATLDDLSHKTNTHIGLVTATLLQTAAGNPTSMECSAKDEHFVGWYTLEGLEKLNTAEGGETIVYRHSGFEPWAQLIIAGLKETDEKLLKRYESKLEPIK